MKVYPKINNYLGIVPAEFSGYLYVQLKPLTQIVGITVLNVEPSLFGKDGVLAVDETKQKVIIAVQQGAGKVAFTELKDKTIEEFAEEMNNVVTHP